MRRLYTLPLPSPALPSPGPAYLDVMALWNHHIFLGEQVLDSILGDDVLYLEKGGDEAGAEALLNQELSKEDLAGGQGHPPSTMAARSSGLQSTVPP